MGQHVDTIILLRNSCFETRLVTLRFLNQLTAKRIPQVTQQMWEDTNARSWI